MSMNERKMMDNALKKVVIPVLRKLEFKGSLPHFRRMNENNIDLITFQFNSLEWFIYSRIGDLSN